MSLNPSQQNALAVTLRQLERALDQIESLLAQDREGILYSIHTQMPDDRRQLLSDLEREARRLIAELAAKYQLAVQEQNGLRIMSSLLSSSWESLVDAHPRKLGNYGRVDPSLAGELGPVVDRLVELTLAMERLTR